jgi:hypothetical protein
LSKGGSPKEHIQAVCLEIFWLCVERRIDLRPEWIPRDENQLADYLFKVRDSYDFGLSSEAFAFISSRFGPPSVDRFASQHNTKLPRFNAFYWCPQAEACNAFTQDWGADGRSYCFPPPHLVARTLQHARACRARITLVVLGWRTAPWWPLLCGSVESGRGFAPFVWGQLFFPQSRKILVPGLASTDQFCGYGVPLCDVFALDVDFTDSKCLLRFSFLILFSSNVRADVFLHEGWDLTVSGLPESELEVRRLLSTLKSAHLFHERLER